MDIILQGLDHVARIQDDILITEKDDDQHIKNLNSATTSRCDDYGLRLQLSKCKLMHKSVTYMGCIISAEGISQTDEKVETNKQAPRLRTPPS